jgi:hypothetical protein
LAKARRLACDPASEIHEYIFEEFVARSPVNGAASGRDSSGVSNQLAAFL